MKKIIKHIASFLGIAAVGLLSTQASAQTGNIRFTAKKNPVQENQVMIYGKNYSGSAISGVIGSSNITLCITFPAAASGTPVISSPISGQTFDAPQKSKMGLDSIYSWNGTGSTGPVDFPGGGNTEVLLATVSFTTGAPGMSATVRIRNYGGSGPSGFDYCYIAPGGTEQSGYLLPFYSNITSDPLLTNAITGINDIFSQTLDSWLGIASVILPTKFINFLALKKDDNASLTWTVDNEENNNYFDVQRSIDGRNFTDVIRVTALRNGRTSNTYTVPDANISRLGVRTIYYRIKQVETTGEVIFSEVRQISLDKKNFEIALYPNPVITSTKLVIDAPEAGKAVIIVRDVTGKTVQQISMEFVKGINQKELNASALAAGEYNVTVIGEKMNQAIKMTKSR